MEETKDLEREIENLKVVMITLGLEQKEHETTLNKEEDLLQGEVQKRTKEMRDNRETNENMLHQIEEMKEQTVIR